MVYCIACVRLFFYGFVLHLETCMSECQVPPLPIAGPPPHTSRLRQMRGCVTNNVVCGLPVVRHRASPRVLLPRDGVCDGNSNQKRPTVVQSRACLPATCAAVACVPGGGCVTGCRLYMGVCRAVVFRIDRVGSLLPPLEGNGCCLPSTAREKSGMLLPRLYSP